MIWENCLDRLQEEVTSDHFNMWLRPLQSDWDESARRLRLFAPNRHVVDQVNQAFVDRIAALLRELTGQTAQVSVEIGSRRRAAVAGGNASLALEATAPAVPDRPGTNRPEPASSPTLMVAGGEVVPLLRYGLDTRSTFENFVCGKSNDLARAAAMQVGENPGQSYNPLFIYGGVGLGKTHLMHAVGNAIVARNPKARVVYIRSEDFVNQLVTSFHNNSTSEFRRRYRSVDALFIDDIHFFVNKSSSQEELFHTFNALVEGGQQIILTSDRFPKEIEGLEERLKSRFSWGLTVSVEPPELETRVAILVRKATDRQLVLPQDVAFFMAQKIRGNVRDLEGALTKVVALAEFKNVPITADLARDALRDLLAMQARLIQIDNIQRTVAEYYKIKLTDLLSAKRNRSLARPRQMAMALAKELTSHSLPEIGDQFGKRDHTTVLHGVRKIAELRNTHPDIEEDWRNLSRLLTS